MISAEEIRQGIQLRFKSENSLEEGDFDLYSILPKKARVVQTTSLGETLGYQRNKRVVERGHAFHFNSGFRTVFLEHPVLFQAEPWYREIKGYGITGKEIFPRHHGEGDLDFGMYLSHATREYHLMDVAHRLEKEDEVLHGKSSSPVALLAFSSQELLWQMMQGLSGNLMRAVAFGRRSDGDYRAHEQDILTSLSLPGETLQEGLFTFAQEKGRAALVSHLKKKIRWRFQRRLFDELASISSPAGYVVRATRCPFRLSEINIMQRYASGFTPENAQEAAKSAGNMYGALAQRGIIHLVPGLGNITLAGELTDYEDAARAKDHNLITTSWKFFERSFRRDRIALKTLEDYLSLTLGDILLEDYKDAFLQGTGLGKNPRDVARAVIEHNRKDLGELVERRIFRYGK